MLKFRNEDPLELIKRKKTVRNKPEKGVRAFYISKFDPRMPHPRQLISRNYHHLQNHPLLANLFPRKNLIGGTRRQPNLSELLSPTLQKYGGGGPHGDDPGDGGGGGGGGGGRWNGSYHCPSFTAKGKCDVCSHMEETSYIFSRYFNRKFAIHGHNVHLPAGQKNKLKWFVYCCEDMACDLVYIGSTTDVCKRWAGTKKACLDKNSSNTGLYKHFMNGCPGDRSDGQLQHLRWTLIVRFGQG